MTQEEKVNTIVSEIEAFMFEFTPQNKSDKESMLSYFSSMLCALDTDIAIEVMKQLGDEGRHQALAIKINYGY